MLARRKGFDLRRGAGQVAALTCPRHVIHYRSRSNPDKKCFEHHSVLEALARRKGFEPLTFWSVARRSIQLS